MITFSMRHGFSIYLVLFFIWSLFPFHKIYAEDIEEVCKTLCDKEVSKGGEDLFCNAECKRSQCYWGCNNYEGALNSSCHRLCADPQTTQRQFCTRGCTTALESYSQRIKEEIGPLQAPELKTGQKGYSYAVLQWSGRILPNATYYVQSRLIDINGNWNINSALWDKGTGDINVTDLQPYVTYKFKILIAITSSSFVSSPETEPITTLSKGAPSASPEILEISAPTPTVITVSWAPPIFINGPLLGYRLVLEPVNHPGLHPAMREVQANVTSWTFRQLQPSQYYVLSVSASNRDGEGRADTANITTPNTGNLTAEEMPYLILAEDNKVFKQNMKDLFTQPYPLETIRPNNTVVRGIGVHVGRQLLLVSDSNGHVRLVNVTWRDSAVDTCSGLTRPGAVTIDWLNNVAYVVDGNHICHCDFDGNKVTNITGPLPTSPRDIKVDPINGYLYFTQGSPNTGIYRIDLGSIHPDYSVPFQQVVKSQLKTFSVDYNNLQLYFPNETQNTMMSSFLDGTGQINLRNSKVVNPNYYGIVSMVYYDGLFYWTNGSRVFKEDYDMSNGTFYHNSLLFFGHHYLAFNTYQHSIQPKPVPHSPPQSVQALFGADKVYIQWRPPKTLSFQGRGAWKKWEYDVLILENDGSQNQVIQRVKVNEAEISNLEHDTSYVVKVRARSENKVGPWSNPFIGRTLSTDAATASVVVAKGGFMTTLSEVDMYGDIKMPSLIRILGTVTDMTWTKDLVVMATGYSDTVDDVYTYNRLTKQQSSLAIKAVSVAYDWLGKKLYWSSPNLGVIRRSDLSLTNVEFVTQGLARRIKIDAINGRLYWATTRTVESCFLNGEDHVKYFSVPFFSGKHVISITLNFDLKKILWYVRGFDLQELYIADLIEGSTNGEAPESQLVGNFESISDSSNLQYHAHRIFWQNQEGAVTVGDLDVNHTSVITRPGIADFMVYHPSMHPYPAGLDEVTVKVIPDPVDGQSVRCVGTWERFNLTWDTASVNHGQVHYEVSVQFNDKVHMTQTVSTWYEMSGVLPYSLIKVTIRAHTFWGYSNATVVNVYSPMSVPSAPLTPRVYVTQHKDSAMSENSLAADFRWSAPETTNGVVVRYIVYFRYRNNGTKITRPPTSRHYIQKYLEPSVTYSFQVQACTDIGCGNLSDTVSARADAVNPVPKMLVATTNGLQLTDVDSNSDSSVTMETDIEPKTLAFLAQDDRMFWTNEDNELYESCKKDSNSPVRRKLISINGTVQDMAIDWISRTIYLVVSHNSGSSSSIIAYLMDQKIHRIVETRPQVVSSVAVEPYTSSIFWTEVESGTTQNKIYRLTNNNEAQLLSMHRIKRELDSTCNCSQVSFGKVITTDHSKSGKMEILVYDSQSKAIVATDSASCSCTTVVNQSEGFPPDKLSVDHLNIYWYNRQNNSLYIYEKATKIIRKQSVPGLTDMVAYGAHLQPLPSSECLDPGAYDKDLQSSSQTNLTLTVLMEKVTWPPSCQGISRPATKYTLYYKPKELTGGVCDVKAQECLNQTSYDNEVVLSGLRPYTEYTVQGAVSNYYTEYLSEALSQSTVFRTAVGVPSAITDIRLEVMTNKRITLKWSPPSEMNGPKVGLRYLIKYSTQVDNARIEGIVNSSEIPQKIWSLEEFDCTLEMCHTIMNLLPSHMYNIQVLVSNKDELYYSTSKTVSATTFMTPGPPLLAAFTHNSIKLSWEKSIDNSTRSILFFIKKVHGSSQSSDTDEFSSFDVMDNRTIYYSTFSGLKPFTEYRAYMRVNFVSGDTTDGPYKIYKTKAFVPDAPNPPLVEHLTSISGHEVLWEAPNENGDQVINYKLEYRKKGEKKWLQIYNGSDTRWLVDEKALPPDHNYVFRVAAENSIGWGEFSTNSSWFYYLTEELPEDMNIAVVAGITAVLLVLIVVVIMIVWCVLRRRRDVKKKPTQFIAVARGPDMELATLRELPHTAVQQSNTLYAVNFIMPTDADIATLPHFMRDQLTLTKFLGSGAFGEVFEGVARNIISDSSGETKVAVKTLRKSASDQEKEEFLKEALLMSNFKHQHILRLLGVCLDNDPQFIILELMEGGDLLSFLRGCRPSQANPVYLSMADLIKICVHVARGCKYLEEMHFVHRDLAARNCLVSSKNPAEFRVKIGDFGLARDIYKNDYYRKEGEGLLPVRWMSPESLVDGVFTTQSDIWAFGVLMWEVITFGQQPYPARTNIEVLNFVRSGGQLDKPDSCPQELFFLMKKCWSSNTEDRPSFSLILHTLEEFHQKCIALLSDYITPIRSRTPQGSEADGCDRELAVKQKRRAKQRTSSLGHDSSNTSRLYDPEALYRKIHRDRSQPDIHQATSFDSPVPRTETFGGYLRPQTAGAPTYLDLISDPSDPPPPPPSSVHHKSRSFKPSLSSRHTSVSSCPMSISSRNSSCSSDPFYHPMDSNLMVNLPAYPADKSAELYQQIHSLDSPSGGCEVPYATVSRSIPEEKDDVFEDNNYKFMELPPGYDYVPGQLKSSTNNKYSNGYSVIDSSKRQSNKNRGALTQDGYMHVETPSRHQLLAASSSDDVKMSQINLYNACNESKDDITSENSSYISYDPASLPRRVKADRQNGNVPSHSAEMYVRYGDHSVNYERPYSSAEARLVYGDQAQRDKHNNRHNRKHVMAVNDSNYVDCNKSRSFLNLTGDNSLLTNAAYTGIHPVKNVIIDSGHLPTVHGFDNSRSTRGSKSQVYPVNSTSPKHAYPETDEILTTV